MAWKLNIHFFHSNTGPGRYSDCDCTYFFFFHRLTSVLRTCSSKDFRPNGFFDVTLAFKLVEYILYGCSIFKAQNPTAKEIGQRLGIFSPAHLDRLLYIYLHLKNYLPRDLLNFLGARSRVELDLSSNLFVSEAKEARKQLRLKYETHAVHIRANEVCCRHRFIVVILDICGCHHDLHIVQWWSELVAFKLRTHLNNRL